VALAPSPYEIAFTLLAESGQDIDRTIEAASEAAREMAREASPRRDLGGKTPGKRCLLDPVTTLSISLL
jgi:hypothetical protein